MEGLQRAAEFDARVKEVLSGASDLSWVGAVQSSAQAILRDQRLRQRLLVRGHLRRGEVRARYVDHRAWFVRLAYGEGFPVPPGSFDALVVAFLMGTSSAGVSGAVRGTG